MKRRNIIIGLTLVLLVAAGVGGAVWYKRKPALVVTTETIKARDLEAIVSASGKIQPKRLVNISADTPGRVVNLAVDEGHRVTKGQFLLQIDPRSLRTRVDNSTASLRAAEGSLEQMRQSIETARVQVQQAQQNLTRQRDLWARQLTTRESLDKAENDVKASESTRKSRASPRSAREWKALSTT
jgi:HlyD family secretion protein